MHGLHRMNPVTVFLLAPTVGQRFPFSSEISQHLLDWVMHNLIQTFIVPRLLVLMTLGIAIILGKWLHSIKKQTHYCIGHWFRLWKDFQSPQAKAFFSSLDCETGSFVEQLHPLQIRAVSPTPLTPPGLNPPASWDSPRRSSPSSSPR